MAIQEEMKEIKALLKKSLEDSNSKKRKFKFPFGKKVGGGQRKKNFVTVLLINENGSYDFKKYQIDEQTILHDMIPRLATTGHVMYDKKGNPLVILPNWSVEPFSPLQHFNSSLNNGSNKKAYKILMAKMLSSGISQKPQVGGMVKWIIGIGFLAIIAYAFVTSGG